MEKPTIDKISKSKQKDLPKEKLQEILKPILKNILLAIGIMLYLAILNIAYSAIQYEKLEQYIKIFSIVFFIAGLMVIETAYKKDQGTLAINGIELLVVAFYSLSITHITTLLNYDFKFYLLITSYSFAIYYVLKSIIIYTKEKRKYLKNLSDIPQIVKKEEPIKKEAKKRNI